MKLKQLLSKYRVMLVALLLVIILLCILIWVIPYSPYSGLASITGGACLTGIVYLLPFATNGFINYG